MSSDRRLATVLFTDIVDSTKRAAEIGDQRWRQLLQRHHMVVRRELGRFGGRELNMTGDGFLAAFDVPEKALRCAWSIRESLRPLGIDVRAGLHTGEVEVMEKTVGGLGVHIGARVAAQAGPGEVLVSSTLRDLVAGSGFDFEDRGVHALKGVPGEWRLSALASAPVRLPVSSFWARAREARLPRVVLIYLIAAGVVLWVTNLASARVGLPTWMTPGAILLLVIGLLVLVATAWVQSRPLTVSRVAADEVPRSWEVDLPDVGASLARGRLPHLTWARAILGGVFAFSLLFGLAGLYVLIQNRGRSLGPAQAMAGPEPGLAVLPFRTVGEDLELWREGMVDLLSTNLDGAPGIRTIAPRTVVSRWRSSVGETPEPSEAQALQVARAVGAKHALIGSLVALGGEVRLTAQLYDLERSKTSPEIEVRGAPDSIPALVDRLSVGALQQVLEGSGHALPGVDLRRVTTSSLPALKAFLAGEQSFRRSRWQEAMRHFSAAVEADSTFALAFFRLSLTYGWAESVSPVGLEYEMRARRLADRLAERESLLLRGSILGWTGPDPPAIRVMEAFTARYPDDAEGWYLLGDALYHLGGQLLRPAEEWRRALQRALTLDPSFGPAYIHLVQDAFARRDSVEAARLIGSHRQIDPNGPAASGFDLAFALAWGDSLDRARLRAALDTLDTAVITSARSVLSSSPEFPEASLDVARALLAERHSPTERRQARWDVARAYYAVGRTRAAQDWILSSLGEPPFVDQNYAWSNQQVLAHVDSLLTKRRAEVLLADTAAMARFFLGLLAADEQRWLDADRHVRELEEATSRRESEPDSATVFHRGLAEALRGYAAMRQGDDAAAVRQIRASLPKIPGMCPSPTCLLHTGLRFELGKMLLEQGDVREAERYLRSVELAAIPRAPAQLYLGKLYEVAGDVERARLHYATFVRLWEDSDAELRPMWEDARRALNRLTAVRRL